MSRYIRCSNLLANRIHDKDGRVLKTNEKREWTIRISQLVPVRHCIRCLLSLAGQLDRIKSRLVY